MTWHADEHSIFLSGAMHKHNLSFTPTVPTHTTISSS